MQTWKMGEAAVRGRRNSPCDGICGMKRVVEDCAIGVTFFNGKDKRLELLLVQLEPAYNANLVEEVEGNCRQRASSCQLLDAHDIKEEVLPQRSEHRHEVLQPKRRHPR